MYPYPQFGALIPSGSPTGKTYYNALQIKMTTLTRNGFGQLTGGFGTINATAAVNAFPTLGGLPRTGTLIARFSF